MSLSNIELQHDSLNCSIEFLLVSFFTQFYTFVCDCMDSVSFIRKKKCFPPSDISQKDKSEEDVEEPYITAYLHSHERPNEFNCTDKKRITLGMTRGQDLDHRKYTFFLSPE